MFTKIHHLVVKQPVCSLRELVTGLDGARSRENCGLLFAGGQRLRLHEEI